MSCSSFKLAGVSRRSFLSAGAAALVVRPLCLIGAERRPEISFAIVTDTHLGYKDQEQAAGQWEKTAAEIEKSGGEVVLHLGDVVDGGREAQYPVYLEGRKQIKRPVHEIPGNHDPPKLFAKYLREPIDTAIDVKWLRCLLLNNSHFDSHDGFLTAEQLAWIDRECSEAARREQFVLLGMHVPAHANKHPDRGWHVQPDQGQTGLYALLEKHRARVLALLHGHFHNGLRGWDDHPPAHEICFPSALYNQDRKLTDQKAPGYNLPEFRPGFTLATIKEGTLTFRYQPVGAAEGVEKQLELRPLK